MGGMGSYNVISRLGSIVCLPLAHGFPLQGNLMVQNDCWEYTHLIPSRQDI